jgi:hypothetical protein
MPKKNARTIIDPINSGFDNIIFYIWQFTTYRFLLSKRKLPGETQQLRLAAFRYLAENRSSIHYFDSLNYIWDVKPKADQGILATLRKYFFSLR